MAVPGLHHQISLSLSVLFLLSSFSVSPSLSLTCTTQKFSQNRLFSHCADLSQLSSSLHWTHDAANSSLSVAFTASPPSSSGWVAWALNPTSEGMVGAQTLAAFKGSDGVLKVRTYDITSYGPIEESKLSFEAWDLAAESGGEAGSVVIFAKVKVPEKSTKVNQVWQVGSTVVNGVPARHDFGSANMNAKGTLDLAGGGEAVVGGGGGDERLKKRNIHGILNVVSWGILFPVGIIIARYLKVSKSADPAWFYLHVFCQVSAYAIGVAGWGTGMKLGSMSKGIQYSVHRNIGIALFSIATLQIFALFLRPKKDHKLRLYWNIYHHSIGYAILILGVINVFKGFDILNPAKKWKTAYIIVIAVLGGIALVLEAITWVVVLKRKSRSKSTKPYDGYNNGQGSSTQQPLGI